MKTILSPKFTRILRNKRKLEKILNIKITNRGREIKIEASPEEEYVAEKVIDALNFGFKFSEAISIKEEDRIFEIINIKEHTTKKDLSKVRARIIGKDGRCLKTLRKLTNCYLEIRENQVGVIGNVENIENITAAIASIARGSKHSNIYCHLEKSHPQPIYDLGLRHEE